MLGNYLGASGRLELNVQRRMEVLKVWEQDCRKGWRPA